MLKIGIIGCGIAGPAAALFLRSLDAEITIFDKVSDLKPIGAGFLLQPAGLDVLNHLGLAEELIDKGALIEGLYGKNHRGKTVLDLRYRDLVPYHMGLGMHRAVLYEALLNKMKALHITIKNPCKITHIENSTTHVILKDEQGHSFGPFDCVIIADGSNSTLRTQVLNHIKCMPYEWGALWAIAIDKEQQFNTILEQVYQGTEKMAGILPMGYQEQQLLLSFFWSMKRSQFNAWKNTPFSVWKEQVIQLWPKLTPLFDQFNSHDQFALASYSDIRVYPWHNKRVVVIGDAAHGMSPQLGQGANLSLIDAKVLFECLSKEPVQDALTTYTQTRKSQLNFYQTANHFVTPWFQSSHFMMGFLRDLLHGTFCKTPILKKQMLLTLACMKTGYFSSTPLNAFPPLARG
jgi:2-polyprenyl-6-methoxyphenol hydroxylase-like FAD-dependent oxidoreductase